MTPTSGGATGLDGCGDSTSVVQQAWGWPHGDQVLDGNGEPDPGALVLGGQQWPGPGGAYALYADGYRSATLGAITTAVVALVRPAPLRNSASRPPLGQA